MHSWAIERRRSVGGWGRLAVYYGRSGGAHGSRMWWEWRCWRHSSLVGVVDLMAQVCLSGWRSSVVVSGKALAVDRVGLGEEHPAVEPVGLGEGLVVERVGLGERLTAGACMLGRG